MRNPRSRQRVTIIDVARQAGVSPSTVSNVLNGRPEAMTPETLERVRTAIRDLNFRPSSTARGLVTQRSSTIGLVLAEIETPLFLQALNHIEPAARAAGYNLLLCNARNVSDEREALTLLLEKDVDGVILLSTSQYVEDSHLEELRRAGLPSVLVNRAGEHPDFDQVNWDNGAGVIAAVTYLAGLGHRRVAFMYGPEERRSSVERLRGYREGLAACELAWQDEYLRPGDYTGSAGGWRDSALALLELSPRPTAILAADDVVAAVVMKTVQSAGLRVPEDVSIVGIDDQPFGAYLNPALTTVRLPVVEAGEIAVTLLLDRIQGRLAEAQHIVLPCPLVVRESCAAPGR